jgi:hypothetical protein
MNGYIFTVLVKLRGGFTTYYECFRSTDYGESWAKILDFGNTMLITPSGGIYMSPWVDSWIVPVLEDGVYYSSDNGDNWIKKSNGLPSNSYRPIHRPPLAMGADGTLYIGTYEHGIYCTTNGGDEWLPLASVSEFNYGYIQNITVATDSAMFLAAYAYGVFKSIDKGVTWNRVPSVGGGYSYVRNIVYNPITEHIFISGLWRSTNLGASWHHLNNGLPDNGGDVFAVNPKTGMMFVGATGRDAGVYRSIDQTVVSVKEPATVSDDGSIILFQNNPNPFNPLTIIKYQLADASQVSIKVYDIMGREVATLVNTYQEKGIYDYTFNATGLASGIYFYKLNANGVQMINKMLLIK